MGDKQIFVGLDIGTTKVCTVVGTSNSRREIEIIGVGSHPSHGLRKGGGGQYR